MGNPIHPPVPPRRRPKRGIARRLAVWISLVTAVLLTACAGIAAVVYTSAHTSTADSLEFATPLAVPPVLEPTTDAEGRKRFPMDIQSGTSELLPGVSTPTWGVNGAYLGPTLRLERGDDVAMDVTNSLAEPTTLHWHGMRVPAAMDGGPHQMIEPGKTWSPEWTVDQPAASLWYHPHLHGATGPHVYRGVSGMILVDDGEEPASLPSEYGVDDFPLIVQDRRFTPDGELDLRPGALGAQELYGLMGDTLLVNGTHAPYLDVPAGAVRFRVLNGSNARSYDFGFTDDRSFQVIATDTGMLREPAEVDRIPLSPGERAEIVVDFAEGEEALLRSFPPRNSGSGLENRIAGAEDTFDVLEVRAGAAPETSPSVPGELVDTADIVPEDGATVRTFSLEGTSTINGGAMDMARIDEVVPAGAVEVWEVSNPSVAHSFHIHDVAFQVMDIDGAPPPAYLAGRKDTVQVPPGTTVRLAVQFGDHTDPETPYMYHCHMLEHEDNGMMGQFTVVEPGTEDEAPRTIDAPDVPVPAGGHGH
ncbi:multicopper oxidase family protein [Nocardiopsis coralliicola]